MKRTPIVNYLDLDGPKPHLVVTRCRDCKAAYLGQRIACARCGARSFDREHASDTGEVRSFSIVYRAAAGIAAPFVSALIRLDDGTMVKSNLLGCATTPEQITLGMKVALETYLVGVDDDGVEAVAFGFVPAGAAA